MNILFPSEPFSPKEVDSSFKSEYEAAKLVGFSVFLFDHDELVKNGEFKTNVRLVEGSANEIILRSWMLKEEQYKLLWSKLFNKKYFLVNTTDEYLRCHYFPEAYNYISKHTAVAWWSNTWSEHPDADNIQNIYWEPIRNMLGGDILIKDYVKSEKGNPDLFILKKELTNEEFSDRVQRFIDARGKLFNKGLVFKSIEKLKLYEGQTNEWRFFIFNNKLVIGNQNSENPIVVEIPSSEIMDVIRQVSKKVKSNFFTIDIAEKEDGTWTILELGDGQVSGLPLVGDAIGFYNKLNNILIKSEDND